MLCGGVCAQCKNKDCRRRGQWSGGKISAVLSDRTYMPSSGRTAAVDIGTTTLAFMLSGGGRVYTSTAENPQRAFGADVISRIERMSTPAGYQLTALIRRAVGKGIAELIEKAGIADMSDVRTIIAGNTVMTHILMDYPCAGLGVYPFTPYKTDTAALSYRALGIDSDGEAAVFPCVSAFIGGDITAGMYALSLDERDKFMLCDLGTNGELALSCGGVIYTASAAAGPAFEGGAVSCGAAAVSGAVCAYDYKSGTVTTINNQKPIGICGTGLIDVIAEAFKYGIIDETGRIIPEYADEGIPVGNLRLTQADVRELQTAKAAVRAGEEILLKRAGLSWDDIGGIYLCGGFGRFINADSAAECGLFPKDVPIIAVGNTALEGCAKAAVYGIEGAERIRGLCRHIELADDEDFTRIYMNQMYFGR